MPYKLPAIPRRQLKLSRFFLRSVLKSVPAIGAILEIPDNVSTVLPAKAMIAAIAEHTVFGFWYISTDDVRRWSQRFRVDGRGCLNQPEWNRVTRRALRPGDLDGLFFQFVGVNEPFFCHS
jgi:hypothetical protein